MPELPEVETTLRGIMPQVQGHKITQVIVRERRLRWPIASDFSEQLTGQKFYSSSRRGKYILLQGKKICLIVHLGMSGSLRILPRGTPPRKHDHVDIVFAPGHCLRFHDPRRFGCLLLTAQNPLQHDLLAHLGPEPLSEQLTGQYVYTQAHQKKVVVKSFIMNSRIVVGVGNIYANEALFLAGICPSTPVGTISSPACERLAHSIKTVLTQAIDSGGTTLRDFVSSEGKPGYFKQSLNVYGRAQLPCRVCAAKLTGTVINQRATVYCPQCQPRYD